MRKWLVALVVFALVVLLRAFVKHSPAPASYAELYCTALELPDAL